MELSELELDLLELALLDAIQFIRTLPVTKENTEKKELYLIMYNKIVGIQINQ